MSFSSDAPFELDAFRTWTKKAKGAGAGRTAETTTSEEGRFENGKVSAISEKGKEARRRRREGRK
jgi:hypothetical protein